MIKNTFLIIFSLLPFLLAQSGKVIESLVFESDVLNSPVEYSVYLPSDYEQSQRSYPVLYLLHGCSDDETGWIQFGEANAIADESINNGDCTPYIIIIPDGKLTWYLNKYDGSNSWEDLFIEEFSV